MIHTVIPHTPRYSARTTTPYSYNYTTTARHTYADIPPYIHTTTQLKMSSNTNPDQTTHTETHTQGLQTRRSVLGNTHVDNALATNNTSFTRPLQDFITEYAWGHVWNRPGLDRKQRSLLNLGMLIALNRTPEFGMHVRGAVRNGVSEVEIREVIVQATVYCGAPAAMEAMRKADAVLCEMQESGEYTRVCT